MGAAPPGRVLGERPETAVERRLGAGRPIKLPSKDRIIRGVGDRYRVR